MRISRRSFVGAAAAIPFAEWVKSAEAATTVFTRDEARSAKGKAMLQLYQTAVAKMKATAQTDPTSWQYQWYTHQTPSSKAQLLANVYKTDTKYKALATEMWSTCQAHNDPANENFFLPWHRMFVYFFERIVRKASGNPSFALPYWNYSVSGQFHGVIPPEFGVTTSSLFVGNRNPGVNAGQAIDKSDPGALDLGALSQTAYVLPSAPFGFCSDLDNSIHGSVHVLVGTSTDMGAVPTAGQDPIFWMHHCNIDRLWESWNKNGGKNPGDSTFLTKTFVFADENNNRVVATVKDFLDISKLGYSYDHLEPKPAGFQPAALISSAVTTPITPTDSVARVVLGRAPVSVALASAPQNRATFSARMAAVTSQKVYLVVRDLKADIQPGVIYDVFMNLPANVSGASRAPFKVGVLNFFNAMSEMTGMKAGERSVSFDVTDVLKRQASSGALNDKPMVTIAPAGEPAEKAQPVIGSISIVQQ